MLSRAVWLAIVVNLHTDGPDWTAIVGIFVAGVIGPALGYWAGSTSDKSKQRHEEKMADVGDLRDLSARATVLMGRTVRVVVEIRQLHLLVSRLEQRQADEASRRRAEESDAAQGRIDALGGDIGDARTQLDRTGGTLGALLEEAELVGSALAIRLREGDPIAMALNAITQLISDVVEAEFYCDDDAAWIKAERGLQERLAALPAEAQKKLGSRLD